MTIYNTRIDRLLSSPEAKLITTLGLQQAFEHPEGLIEVERIARDGIVRHVERRLYDASGELAEVSTLSLVSGKATTEDPVSYEHRRAKEDAEEKKTEISRNLAAWRKENHEKQARLDHLGQAMDRLRKEIGRRQEEWIAVKAEFSALMTDKRDFLKEG